MEVGGATPPPAMVAGVAAAYLQGIALVDQRLIFLLDSTRVFRQDENEALQQLVDNETVPVAWYGLHKTALLPGKSVTVNRRC